MAFHRLETEKKSKQMTTPSISSKLITFFLRIIRFKKNFTLPWLIKNGKSDTNRIPPKWLFKSYDITMQTFQQHSVSYLKRKENTEENTIILFLHGGVYVQTFAISHWLFAKKLIDTFDCVVIAPDYPLAPEHQAQETMDFTLALYKSLTAKTASKNLFILGDSAGGGLALALAQRIKQEDLPQPKHLFLLSPWVDITMTNPAIKQVDSSDPILAIDGLIDAGKVFAGAINPANPLVSPINGPLTGLPPISIFIGTNDILQPDAQKLASLLKESQNNVNYFEYPNMIHDWVLFPMPESTNVLEKISKILSK